MDSQKITSANQSTRSFYKTNISLTEYGDYECPYCARAHLVVKRLQDEFGEQLIFNFKNFPLTEMHPHALMAAEAAEAARAQGKFFEMHEALFENQEDLNVGVIAQLAEEIGLDLEKFSTGWSEHIYVPQIQKDLNEGLALGVQGTPSFFINDVFFKDQWSHDRLSTALKANLKSQQRKKQYVEPKHSRSDQGPSFNS